MRIQPYIVVFNLPERLRGLQELATNLWFCWNREAVQLFKDLDSEEWERCNFNPVLQLGRLSQEKLEKAAADESFVARVRDVQGRLRSYLEAKTWFSENRKEEGDPLVAYFSMEFGLHEGVPIYSGGLGILAGDHLKSSSDLGIPLIGVGLLYQKGYFQQYISRDGWQQERYPENDWFNMPVSLERDAAGRPVTVDVEMDSTVVRAQIWKVQVGRVPLYLLDANVPENAPEQRAITANLYGGDRDMRIRQEILLGIGGVRALHALGRTPTVFHMNEGHSALLALERLRTKMADQRLSFAEAREEVWASTVFTTHTPVPAGHEIFEESLVRRYLGHFPAKLGMDIEAFLGLGREPGAHGHFSLTALALRMSALCNGVSLLHGEESRAMFRGFWPQLPEKEVPIGHITNGVHTASWMSHDMAALLERQAGAPLRPDPSDHRVWEKALEFPEHDLWAVRRLRREKLVGAVRHRFQGQLKGQGADATLIKRAAKVLDPDILTIGFARRFAAYKRATLLLRDPERMVRLLTNPERPVQFIFAGKSHPHDQPGKELIRAIVHFAQDPRVRDRVVFLEDYDIRLARYMVHGVDVWLNNPRRPMEASGTSGMKAAVNGALHLSTLDGWWVEGFEPSLGWAIGGGETYADAAEGDFVESEALYSLLENEVAPLFYKRDAEGLPRDWLRMVKSSIASLGSRFNTDRMLGEYLDKAYLRAHRASVRLASDGDRGARDLAAWRAKVQEAWPRVSVSAVPRRADHLKAGDTLPLAAMAHLGGLQPADVAVEAVYGPLNAAGEIEQAEVLRMQPEGASGGETRFQADIPCRVGGRHGFAVRVRPDHPDLLHPFTPCLVTWEK